jgi:hypothetical protein
LSIVTLRRQQDALAPRPGVRAVGAKMDTPATYFNFGFISISVPNLLMILVSITVFVLAILLPFPRHKILSAAPWPPPTPSRPPAEDEDTSNWTYRLRVFLTRLWPSTQLLPDRQPRYVASWIYLFGVGAIAALIWIVISGLILVFFGPNWWHQTGAGRFVNSIHFWSVQLFFGCAVIHLGAKFFMAAWRRGRALTWFVGVMIFATAVIEAFTGYLSQQNFDAQWIALNGKDAINSTGLGAFFNVLDYGQMIGLHVILLPLTVISLVAVHVLLIRLRGVVRPLPWGKRGDASPARPEAPAKGQA